MEGCNSGVDQCWICYRVSAGPHVKDCLGVLYKEGPGYYGCH